MKIFDVETKEGLKKLEKSQEVARVVLKTISKDLELKLVLNKTKDPLSESMKMWEDYAFSAIKLALQHK